MLPSPHPLFPLPSQFLGIQGNFVSSNIQAIYPSCSSKLQRCRLRIGCKAKLFRSENEIKIKCSACVVSGSVIDKKIHLSHFNMSLNCMLKNVHACCAVVHPQLLCFRVNRCSLGSLAFALYHFECDLRARQGYRFIRNDEHPSWP